MHKRKVTKTGRGTDNQLTIPFKFVAEPNDIIIPVMGPTGVGKSTFINTATGSDTSTVGHGLQSCTQKILPVPLFYHGDSSSRVVFIDTPGFDDTWVDDTEILRRIAKWLEQSYRQKKKLTGIIYMHDISRTRMLGSAHRNLKTFNGLCGDDGARNVFLVTTKWTHVEAHVGQQREQELCEVFWKGMLERGSKIVQFRDTHDSAMDLVDTVVKKKPIQAIQIQRELVDLRKILPETEAAITLRRDLEVLLEEERSRARELKDTTPELQAKYNETVEHIRSTLSQIQQLKIPLSRKIMAFLRFGSS